MGTINNTAGTSGYVLFYTHNNTYMADAVGFKALCLSIVTVEAFLSPRLASTTDSQVTLICTMQDYIHPDEQFQWFRADTLLLPELNNRYSVIYVDGFPRSAQNGMGTLTSARLTVLIIADPVVSDTGDYTCAVNGTTQFATVELVIDDPFGRLLFETLDQPLQLKLFANKVASYRESIELC